MTSRLCERLELDQPVIQAPMAGGATTVALVAESSRAGVLGSLGAAYLSAAQIEQAAGAIRERTDRPYAINLFASVPDQPYLGDGARLLALMARYHEQLGLDAPAMPGPQADPLATQIEAVLRARPAVFSFTFGRIAPEVLARCRELGILTVGTATTVREAVALEQDGVDAVVAQGYEAGGHRGTFLDDFDQSLIGTLALVPQVVDAVSVPVIASGGIMDGRGIAAALALGAQAAQMGTAFLSTEESGICDAYKAVLPASRSEQSRITRAFRAAGARHRQCIHARHGRESVRHPALSVAERPDAAHAQCRRPRRRYQRAVAVGGPGRTHGAARERAELARRLAVETATAQARR